MADQPKMYLTIDELSKRWDVPTTTLSQWRSRGQGVPFVKIEHKAVRYRISDVEAYEQARTKGGAA